MKNQLREPDFNLKAFVQQLTPPSKSADAGKGGGRKWHSLKQQRFRAFCIYSDALVKRLESRL